MSAHAQILPPPRAKGLVPRLWEELCGVAFTDKMPEGELVWGKNLKGEVGRMGGRCQEFIIIRVSTAIWVPLPIGMIKSSYELLV